MKRQAEARKALNTHRLNHDLLHLSRIEVRASGRWRAVEILGIGALTIIPSIYVILNMSVGQSILAAILAFALLLVGIRNIVHGFTGHHPVATPIEPAVTAV